MSEPAKIIKLPAKKKKTKGKHASGLIRRHFRYKDLYGVSRSKTVYGATATEAEAKKKEFLADVAAAIRVDQSGKTVSEWVDEWLLVHKKPFVGVRTYETYQKDGQRIKDALGRRTLGSVTSTDLQAIINARKGCSESSIKKTVMTIRAIFKAAAEDRLISFAPAVVAVPGTSSSHRALTEAEIALVVAAAGALDIKTRKPHPFSTAAMLMLFAGLRRGEVAACVLDGSDTIKVTKAIDWPSNQPEIKPPKSKAGIRSIPVLPPLKPFIEPGYAIATEEGIAPVTRNVFLRMHRTFVKLCGVDFRCHDLRHTFATLLFDAGVDVKTAQTWLGHDDPMVTMRIYTHLSKQRASSSAELAEKHFSQYAGGKFGGIPESQPMKHVDTTGEPAR